MEGVEGSAVRVVGTLGEVGGGDGVAGLGLGGGVSLHFNRRECPGHPGWGGDADRFVAGGAGVAIVAGLHTIGATVGIGAGFGEGSGVGGVVGSRSGLRAPVSVYHDDGGVVGYSVEGKGGVAGSAIRLGGDADTACISEVKDISTEVAASIGEGDVHIGLV